MTQSSNGYRHVNGHKYSCESSTVNGHTDASTINVKSPEPIAICGMACRLRQGISTPRHLWEFLLAGDDARSVIPESRFNCEAFYDSSGKPGTTKTRHGYFLDEDLASLDTSFFSMAKQEVERMDPQQRIMLEVARECFEDSGEPEWRGKKIGCYIGSLNEDWLEMLTMDVQNYGVYRLTGYGDASLSNRVSYEMNLQGPSMTIRTACSASLVALHEACTAIERGDCSSALVGGTNIIIRPTVMSTMSEQGLLSADGSCKTFSSAADGYARGEAVVGVYLKSLDAALRDKNSIRAVIRGTATNHDGKTPGYSMPSTEAQETLIRRAYDVAGLVTSETGYVECHGTGTSAGDPVETKAVARVFGDVGVTIGSIKPNLGHTEGASGVLSVIKAVLMLESEEIPPSIKCNPRNPNVPWQTGKLTLAERPLQWPRDRMKRVSVNSFGFGGTNAHVIIDSASAFKNVDDRVKSKQTPQILLFSATNKQSLEVLIDKYKSFAEDDERIEDIAYTLARGREHLQFRSFAVANAAQDGAGYPIVGAPTQRKLKIVMVFTGQGAQWPRMSAGLLKSNSTFQSSIRALDTYFKSIAGEEEPHLEIESELLKFGKKSHVHLAEYAQPLCTAVQIALVDTLRTIGIEADAVVGHSSGEIAAAYAAGALTAQEAMVVALHRGRIMKEQKRAGAMAALGLSFSDAERYIIPQTNIACDNSPRSVTISGDADRIEEIITNVRATRPDVFTRKLQVDKAYHSYHMSEIGEMYNASIERKIATEGLDKPFFSSVENRMLDDTDKLDSRYWQKNLESPVLFNGAVTKLLDHYIDENIVLLEIGPHSALAGPLAQIISEKPNRASYIPTLVRNRGDVECFLSAIGKLFVHHAPINIQALFPSGSCLPDLPRYPWLRRETGLWFESRLSRDFRHRKYQHHDILGVKVVESTDSEPIWRNVLHVNHTAIWLKDHKIGDDVVFPFAAYIAMAGEAIRQVTDTAHAFSIREMSVDTAMVLSQEKPTEIITNLQPLRLTLSQDSDWYAFTVHSHNGQQWIKHCGGEVRAEGTRTRDTVTTFDMAITSPEPFYRAVARERWFETLHNKGLHLGPAFQNLDRITASTTTRRSRGVVSSEEHPPNSNSLYHLHPAVVDSALQLLSVAIAKGRGRKHKNMLPTSCERLFVSRTEDDGKDIVVDWKADDGSGMIGAGEGIMDGKVVLRFEGLKVTPVDIVGERNATTDPHSAARLTWAPDLDLVDLRVLSKENQVSSQDFRALEEIGGLAILEIRDRIAGVEALGGPHLKDYARWIETQARELAHPNGDIILPSPKRRQLVEKLAGGPIGHIVSTIDAVVSKIDLLLSGSLASWESVIDGEDVMQIFDIVSGFDSRAFFKLIGHHKPNLRVLEIANWTRAPSIAALKALTTSDGSDLWSRYTFACQKSSITDERDVDRANLEYSTLNLGGDLEYQGFADCEYDLIIASGLPCDIRDRAQCLQNVHKLLHPDGRLLLQNFAPTCPWINVILGVIPTRDGRGAHEGSSMQAIHRENEFREAGLEDVEVFGSDCGQTSIIAMRRSRRLAPARKSNFVTLLVRDKARCYPAAEQMIREQGYESNKITLKDTPQPNGNIISLLDLDGPFFDEISDEAFGDFRQFINRLEGTGIFWVTKPCHIHVQDPRYAMIIGFARVIRNELSVDFATCEIEKLEPSTFGPVMRAYEKFSIRVDDSRPLGPDFEYVIDGGTVKIGRYYPFTLNDELIRLDKSTVVDGEGGDGGERLTALSQTSGRHTGSANIRWFRQPAATPPPLEPGQLEIEVHAVGISFKDAMISMNLLDGDPSSSSPSSGAETPLRSHGFEAAGIVRRVGPGIDGAGAGARSSPSSSFRPGDRVVTLEHGALTTHLLARAVTCAKIPDRLDFPRAATMALSYATALQALRHVGRLRPGETVLIHSACGGVGLAALHVARMLGADVVLATVGREEKAEYLVRRHGIPRGRIFGSRDDGFVEGVMRETGGKGVDLVLNSLSGELLHASWRCVAAFGRMVEIGKRDLVGRGRLDLAPFAANRSYCCVDVDGFYRDHAHKLGELVRETFDCYEKASIEPLVIAKEFDAPFVNEAIGYFLPGTHIGRVCVRLRDETGRLTLGKDDIVDSPKNLRLDPEAYYLLVGGLGGLGRTISTFMVERGARNLIFFGRSAGQGADDQAFISELESMDAKVITFRGDITNFPDVFNVVNLAPQRLKGVVHLSNIQSDENSSHLTKSQWSRTLGPKVTGTWNLHRATAEIPLDFFVLAGSLASVIGTPGLASYSAANIFLEAFVQYRNNLGLACSAINIGAVTEVGMLVEFAKTQHVVALVGDKTVAEEELLDAMALSMMRSSSSRLRTGVLPFVVSTDACTCSNPSSASSPSSLLSPFADRNVFVLGLASPKFNLSDESARAIWKRDRRMALYHNSSGSFDLTLGSSTSSTASQDRLKAFLTKARADPAILREPQSARLFAEVIGRKFFDLMLKTEDSQETVDTKLGLADLGLDSLVAIELKAWWKLAFGFDISVLEMLGMGNLDGLGALVATKLIKKFDEAEGRQ